ncbi:hypothetical protein [Leifsonia poae]|uniref:hypothetical protein n=1 Tax=Leifsonia poae TaxID=110933 RepID=UPI001CBBF6F7|nr:hypothetical protein [Leifsonia poae]
MTTPFTFSAGRPSETPEQSALPDIPATAFEEPGVSAPTRPHLPSSGSSFDALLAPKDDDPDAGQATSPLYRQAPSETSVEPVTQPVSLVPPVVETPPIPSQVIAPPMPAVVPIATPERALTRRELRAMQQAQEANQQAGHPESVIPVTFSPATHEVKPAEPSASAEDASEPRSWPFAAVPASADPIATAAPVEPVSAVSVSAESALPTAQGEADAAPQPYQPPVGHWSTAAELDDKNQPFDQIISRSVGVSGSATTTNALILPTLPTADATGPLTSTGEILVTGSIDLPRGLGATGAHPDRIDSSDIDRLLDGEDNEFNTSEVAPIRASRAVSTHTSTRGVITPPKKRHGRLPLVLSITAAVLLVGVVGLLVAAYVLKVF